MTNQSEIAESKLTVSRKLHPEDIAIGDDVAVSELAFQFASFLWCGADMTVLPPDQPVQLTCFPYDTHEPLKIKSICLPFVLCQQANESHIVLDVRHTQLVRLNQEFAAATRKALKANRDVADSKRKSKKSKKKRKKKAK